MTGKAKARDAAEHFPEERTGRGGGGTRAADPGPVYKNKCRLTKCFCIPGHSEEREPQAPKGMEESLSGGNGCDGALHTGELKGHRRVGQTDPGFSDCCVLQTLGTAGG